MGDINERFEKAVESLFNNNYYLAVEVTKLGYPKLSNCRTAGVVWNPDLKKVEFIFNKYFADSLTDEEFEFVICHESMHIINLHIFLFRDKIEEMRLKKKTDEEIWKFRNKLNVATDCIVNDSLTNLYGLKKFDFIGKVDIGKLEGVQLTKPVKLIYGIDHVGENTEDLRAMQVYYMLPDKKFDLDDDHDWFSFINPDGSMNEDFVRKIKGLIDKNIQNSNMSEKESGFIERMKKDLSDSRDSNSRNAGNEAVGNFRAINRLGNNSLQWDKILQNFTQSTKVFDNWNRPNRKMMSVYPKVILPSYVHPEKEDIFVAIDTSSSINKRALDLFVDVVRNTPDTFRIKCISFDEKTYEFDAKGTEEPRGGGGTNFKIIEEYIQKNFKKYPKAVFVLTDGDGTFVTPEKPKNWCWLLYGSCVTHYIGDMKRFKIMDILK